VCTSLKPKCTIPAILLQQIARQAAEAKAAKEAEIAKMPKRPTELRDKPQCFKWNGEEKCFSCTSECEYYKTLNPKLDCKQWCTVEYGQPKPTDEDRFETENRNIM
jgi:hypothetical protein